VVVRLYESLGGRATATLTAGFPVGAITETDLLERPVPAGLRADGAELPLTLHPFQIRTLRLHRTKGAS
jgi:alpha-mannosidase